MNTPAHANNTNAAHNAREEQIRAQATSIMNNFFTALKSANVSSQKIGVQRKEQTRTPQTVQSHIDFRLGMFKNAPNKDVDYIIAEKKTW